MIHPKKHFLNHIPLRAFLLLLILVLLGSCKMQGPFYRDGQVTEFTLPEGELSHSVFLLGDAGDAHKNSAFFDHLKKEIKRAGANSDVVNLGDNAYPVGLPGELNKWRNKAEEALDKQVEVYSDYKGDVYFLPGNHDWAKGRQEGLRYVRNQERYLNEAFGRQVFFPGKGCPGPEEIPLNDSLTLIIIDSQWYFYNFEKPLNEDDCGIEDEEDIFIRLEDMLRRNQDKNVLIAAHHPLWSIGVHGGRFDPWLNLFPLRVLNKNLFIPLPGFIYTGGRKYFGNIQDIAHPRYRQFKERILDVTGNFQNVVYASGHEHNLQYTQKAQLHHIISGAASKTSEIVHNKEAEFGLAAPGFARLDITKQGVVWLRYYAMRDEKQGFELVYSKKLYSYETPTLQESDPQERNFPDSVKMAPATHYLATPFQEWLLGSNYRELWAQPVKARVFDIGTEKGGLKPVKRGGGMQTLSVRLEADDGKQYNLRSLDKFAARTVPPPLRETFAAQLVQDNVSATNPYGALVAAFLAEKAGLYHTNPEIVYVPDDERFGVYRQDVSGQLFLFEERPDEDWRKASFFGNSKNVKSTSKSKQDRLE
ncbi:MAG: metallophosphoesterase, partial [Bacteroidota bacterium]